MPSNSSKGSVALLDLLDEEFDEVFVATYEFDPQFFDEYVLRETTLFGGADEILLLLDGRVHDRCLVGGSYRSPHANRTYLVEPVRGRQCFHPKLLLALSDIEWLLVVGSANLTGAGLTRNIELIDSWRWTVDGDAPPSVFVEAASFLGRALGHRSSSGARGRLQDALLRCPQLQGPTNRNGDHLLSSYDGSILAQVVREVEAAGDEIENVVVVSPYFDRSPAVFDIIRAAFKGATIELIVQDRTSTAPADALARWAAAHEGCLTAQVASFLEEERFLHAKALVLRGRRRDWAVFGSANCTMPGLALDYPEGNVELVAFRSAPRARRPPRARLFDGVANLRDIDLGKLDVSQPDEVEPTAPEYPWTLVSARRAGDRLVVEAEGEQQNSPPRVMIARSSGKTQVAMARVDTVFRTERVPQPEESLGPAAVVQLVGAAGEPVSNAVLLEDIVDRATGAGRVGRRLLALAQQSASGFRAALSRVLTDSGDVQRLIEFLWFVDIPVVEVAPAYAVRLTVGGIDPGSIAARMGVTDFRPFRVELSDALKGFWSRHMKRLRRHVEGAWIAGVPNALQIGACLQQVLEMRGDVVLREMRLGVLDNYSWSAVRTEMDQFTRHAVELAEVIGLSYRRALEKEHGRRLALGALAHGREELSSALASTAAWRAAVEEARRQCVVKTPTRKVPAEYFPHDEMRDWPKHLARIEASLGRLVKDLPLSAPATPTRR